MPRMFWRRRLKPVMAVTCTRSCVGAHACFPELAAKTAALLQIQDAAGLTVKLAVERNRWDPYAFIDECEAAAGQGASAPRTELLLAIQKIEFEVLLEHFYRLEQ